MSDRTTADSPVAIGFTDLEFEELAAIVVERTGVFLSPHKKADVEARLATGFCRSAYAGGRALIDAVAQSDRELQRLTNCLTVGESYFFRNHPHFEALKSRVFPTLLQENRSSCKLEIWCAGCAAGEEPYSVSILLREHFWDLETWDVSILGTDINTDFLKQAEKAVYGEWSFRGVDPTLIRKYFTERDGKYALKEAIVRTVALERFNLARFPYERRFLLGEFDLLLCRNVLIYFPFDLANRVVGALAEMVRPGGYLFVGHSESFPSLGNLEAIYADGTYYYRRAGDEERLAKDRPFRRTLAIGGIGVEETPSRLSRLADEALKRAKQIMPSRMPDPASVDGPALDSSAIDIELARARDCADAGDLEQAMEMLCELTDGAGRLDHRCYFLKAIVAQQLGRVLESITSLKQAIFLKKDFVIAHYYLGVIHERDGDKKDALRCFGNAEDFLRRLDDDGQLDETEGLSTGELREIVGTRIKELELG